MARDIYEDYDEAEAPKDAIPTIMAVLTFLVLGLAIYMVETASNEHFEAGLFADDKPAPGTGDQ